jgi:hypothetical protein
MKKNLRSIYFLIPFLLFGCVSASLAQNDTLIMTNGEKLVGEIKSLQRGVMVIETDYSEKDFQVEWNKVEEIYSPNLFIIALSDGSRLNGTINSNPMDSARVFIYESGSVRSPLIRDVVMMKSFDDEFIGRLSANIGVGVDLEKTNNLRRFTTRSSVGYTGKSWGIDASIEAIRSFQDSLDATRRTDASIGGRILFQRSWFVFASISFLQSDEFSLKLRSISESGIGRYLINTNKLYLGTGAGVAWNNEQFTDGRPQKNSLEALLGIELNIFDVEDFSLQTTLSLYPSITDRGRIRSDFKFDLSYDLPYDFYIKLGFTHNFDNRADENSKLDYTFTTTFGWEL